MENYTRDKLQGYKQKAKQRMLSEIGRTPVEINFEARSENTNLKVNQSDHQLHWVTFKSHVGGIDRMSCFSE